MCLFLNRGCCSRVATEDILVYKALSVKYKLKDNSLHGKSFKGTISEIDCKGILSCFEDELYLCTNNNFLIGSSIDNKFGYNYSWWLDSDVTNIIIDEEISIVNKKEYNLKYFKAKYYTPYQFCEIKLGETYKSSLIKGFDTVSIGLHSFETLEGALSLEESIVVECIIPKGATYYKGDFDNYVSYASDTLTYTNKIVND